jgi:hypothetical protein
VLLDLGREFAATGCRRTRLQFHARRPARYADGQSAAGDAPRIW